MLLDCFAYQTSDTNTRDQVAYIGKDYRQSLIVFSIYIFSYIFLWLKDEQRRWTNYWNNIPKSHKSLDFKPCSHKDKTTRISPCTHKGWVLIFFKKFAALCLCRAADSFIFKFWLFLRSDTILTPIFIFGVSGSAHHLIQFFGLIFHPGHVCDMVICLLCERSFELRSWSMRILLQKTYDSILRWKITYAIMPIG